MGRPAESTARRPAVRTATRAGKGIRAGMAVAKQMMKSRDVGMVMRERIAGIRAGQCAGILATKIVVALGGFVFVPRAAVHHQGGRNQHQADLFGKAIHSGIYLTE